MASLSKSSSSQTIFKTPEEADVAYKAHLASKGGLTRLSAAKFPARHIETLERMKGPSLAKAKELWPKVSRGGMIFLIGDRGPGKTQMATWMAWKFLCDERSCGYYVKLADLYAELRGTWGRKDGKTEADILSRYFKVGFLVIDEAQERGSSENDRDWCDRTLTNLIDHRYDAMLATVLCGNYSLEAYQQNIPAAIQSRLVEAGGVVVCDWPSYRK